MDKYRIIENKYKSGKIEFLPQFLKNGLDEQKNWITISHKLYRLNKNGFHYCTTYVEAVRLINKFKQNRAIETDYITTETVHEIN